MLLERSICGRKTERDFKIKFVTARYIFEIQEIYSMGGALRGLLSTM